MPGNPEECRARMPGDVGRLRQKSQIRFERKPYRSRTAMGEGAADLEVTRQLLEQWGAETPKRNTG